MLHQDQLWPSDHPIQHTPSTLGTSLKFKHSVLFVQSLLVKCIVMGQCGQYQADFTLDKSLPTPLSHLTGLTPHSPAETVARPDNRHRHPLTVNMMELLAEPQSVEAGSLMLVQSPLLGPTFYCGLSRGLQRAPSPALSLHSGVLWTEQGWTLSRDKHQG